MAHLRAVTYDFRVSCRLVESGGQLNDGRLRLAQLEQKPQPRRWSSYGSLVPH